MTKEVQSLIDLQSEQIHHRLVYTNMIIFLVGKLVSLLGSRIMNFAIGLYVLSVTGSGMNFAFTMILSTIPAIILSPIAGAIADVSNRKFMVVLMDALSGFLLIGIFISSMNHGLSLIHIYISVFFLSIFNTFFSVAMEASIPNIVDKKRLTKINSYNSSISSLAAILGPVLGGFVYGFINIEIFILLNGISFVLSSISEMFIDFKLSTKGQNETMTTKKANVYIEMKAGFDYIKTKKVIFSTMILSIYVNFVFSGYMVALPFIVNTNLGLSSDQYGLIQAAFAIGSLLFSLLFSTMSDKKSKYLYVILSMFIISFLMMITGIPSLEFFKSMGTYTIMIYFMLLNFMIGCALIFVNLPFFIMLQKQTPDEYRGRVNGLLGTMSLSISPIGMILGGLLIDLLPSFILPLICGMLFMVLSIVLHKQKEFKTLL